MFNETENMITEEMQHIIKAMVNIKQANNPGMNFAEIMNPQNMTDVDPSEPSIMFLGTVSMKPT